MPAVTELPAYPYDDPIGQIAYKLANARDQDDFFSCTRAQLEAVGRLKVEYKSALRTIEILSENLGVGKG